MKKKRAKVLRRVTLLAKLADVEQSVERLQLAVTASVERIRLSVMALNANTSSYAHSMAEAIRRGDALAARVDALERRRRR